MNLETHSFQQLTEVSWLSTGPAIKRILEQWEAICHFISELAKEPKKMPKSINFKRCTQCLVQRKRQLHECYWEFFNSMISVFEEF